jgi:hypothetical protein
MELFLEKGITRQRLNPKTHHHAPKDDAVTGDRLVRRSRDMIITLPNQIIVLKYRRIRLYFLGEHKFAVLSCGIGDDSSNRCYFTYLSLLNCRKNLTRHALRDVAPNRADTQF